MDDHRAVERAGVGQLGIRQIVPAILWSFICRPDLSPGPADPDRPAVSLAFLAIGVSTFLLRRPPRLSNPRLTSFFHPAMRFDRLLASAVAAQGPDAVSDIAMAFLRPAFRTTAEPVCKQLPPGCVARLAGSGRTGRWAADPLVPGSTSAGCGRPTPPCGSP